VLLTQILLAKEALTENDAASLYAREELDHAAELVPSLTKEQVMEALRTMRANPETTALGLAPAASNIKSPTKATKPASELPRYRTGEHEVSAYGPARRAIDAHKSQSEVVIRS